MRSSVDVSAQCRSSSTSSTGADAACSVEQRERRPRTPAAASPAGPSICRGLARAAQRVDERLVRQLRADEIDRAPEQYLEPASPARPRQLGREPGLADARLSGDEDGRTAPRLGRVRVRGRAPRARARARRTPSLAPSLHPASIARHPRLRRAVSTPATEDRQAARRKIRLLARCALAPLGRDDRPTRQREEESDDSDREAGADRKPAG